MARPRAGSRPRDLRRHAAIAEPIEHVGRKTRRRAVPRSSRQSRRVHGAATCRCSQTIAARRALSACIPSAPARSIRPAPRHRGLGGVMVRTSSPSVTLKAMRLPRLAVDGRGVELVARTAVTVNKSGVISGPRCRTPSQPRRGRGGCRRCISARYVGLARVAGRVLHLARRPTGWLGTVPGVEYGVSHCSISLEGTLGKHILGAGGVHASPVSRSGRQIRQRVEVGVRGGGRDNRPRADFLGL